MILGLIGSAGGVLAWHPSYGCRRRSCLKASSLICVVPGLGWAGWISWGLVRHLSLPWPLCMATWGFLAAQWLQWRQASFKATVPPRRQDWELPYHQGLGLESGIASLLPHSIGQSSHRDHPHSKGGDTESHLLMAWVSKNLWLSFICHKFTVLSI